MRVLGINGIRNHGEKTTDLLLQGLADKGWDTVDVNYPYRMAIQAHFTQDTDAQTLLEAHEPGDCVIAHSYGCLVTFRAMQLGAQFGSVFLFAPALAKDVTFPFHGCEQVHVIHHPDDQAIALGSIIPWHDFGQMGRKGYQGPLDMRVKNWESKGESDYDPTLHSHYFSDRRRAKWVDFIDARLHRYQTGLLR